MEVQLQYKLIDWIAPSTATETLKYHIKLKTYLLNPNIKYNCDYGFFYAKIKYKTLKIINNQQNSINSMNFNQFW